MKKIILCIACMCALLNYSVAQTNNSQDAINGTWLVQDGSAKVRIEKAGGKYVGKIVWLKDPNDKNGRPMLDAKNPDKTLQSRTQIGLPLLKDFVYDGPNSWTDGEIYDPDSGKTYSCKITMKTNQVLEVRGYVGISLFGRTDNWKRVENITMN